MKTSMHNEQAIRSPVDVEALYRANVRAIYAFVYRRVGNREAAEDLTSDVFMKALAHLDSTYPEPSILAWLYRVAHNAIRDYWRAARRAPFIALDETRLVRTSHPYDDTVRQDQTAAQATTLLVQLPENYRTVLSCRLLQGLSVVETAAQMGTSEGNVKVLQHRALKRAAALREAGVGHG